MADVSERRLKDVLEALVSLGGDVNSPDGKASTILHNRVEPPMSKISLALKTLESRGLIQRLVSGRRTYSITLTEKGEDYLTDPNNDPPVGAVPYSAATKIQPPNDEKEKEDDNLDYDKLGAALLRRIVAIEQRSDDQLQLINTLKSRLSQATRQLEQGSKQLEESAEIQTELATDNQKLQNTVDDLRAQVNDLIQQIESAKNKNTVRELIPEDTRRELDRIMKERPGT